MFRAIAVRGFLSLGFAVGLTPAVFAVGPALESQFFPVVVGTEISRVESVRNGVAFFTRFHKARQCEFRGIVWYQGETRYSVQFEPGADQSPRTRPVGDQYTGPWLVLGLSQLEGSRTIVYHRCHPLWTTVTTFYEN